MKSIQIILAKEKKSLSIWTPNDDKKKNHHILHVLICDWCMYGIIWSQIWMNNGI